ncbi:MAG: 4-hydroxythreonine-4-phosphate dehydrogenase PdxA, partial [Candidatus Margulisbacteria bacterium]|nr:4-hydroxythreonine-4-phosphate dehydrogenase PdxA [Candidatus Margulisiibacteriota bacterium]
MKPLIAITAGDLTGIGPEIIAKSLSANPGLLKKAGFLLIGSKSVLLAGFKKYTRIKADEINIIKKVGDDVVSYSDINILDCPEFEVSAANINSKSGILSYKFVETAVKLVLAKKVSAVVTAPINKNSWQQAGIKFPGHTEALAQLSHCTNYAMAFYSKKLKVILETIHCPLSRVSEKISTDSIYNKIMLADNFLRQLKNKSRKIAVAGLNPHAGESGLMGREEIEIIAPAINKAGQQGIQVQGPIPADTLFYRAVAEK